MKRGKGWLTYWMHSRGMYRFPVMVFLCFSACAVPSPQFMGVDPVQAEVQQSRFVLRRKGNLVEVIRVSREWAPRLSEALGRRAEIAVEETYGCPVRDIRGDAALMIARLKCGRPDDLAVIGYGPK
ncbi:MAG: hypothetical protein GYB25_02750 [Rhodobacteraceae bacterium]|nr:hypothetical protein [Paracoccaceae bacterium]